MHMEKYRTVLLLLYLMSLFRPLSAQQLSVERFYLDEMDITANLSAVIDPNSGKKCALIKVQTSLQDLHFDLGTTCIVKVEPQNARHPMEVYVWHHSVPWRRPGFGAGPE